MMIVIVIVAILLAMTLWISGNRIQTLKNKSVQEQFTYTYNSLFSRNLLTNYYDGKLYDEMVISLGLWENRFSYSYKNNGVEIFSGFDDVQWGKYTIYSMYIGGGDKTTQPVTIVFRPYVLWCEISKWESTWKILELNLLLNDKENHCVKINSDLCKLEKVECE